MPLLVQLAGAPGSGKSTLAHALAKRYDAVVLDMDVAKSALLDADVPWRISGGAAYTMNFALADNLLGQGRAVVLDSPSYYPEVPAKGSAIAARHRAHYRFVECVCDDLDEIRRRLAARTRLRSQMRDVGQPSPDAGENVWVDVHARQTIGPDGGHLVVDSTQPPERVAELVFSYVDQPMDLPR